MRVTSGVGKPAPCPTSAAGLLSQRRRSRKICHTLLYWPGFICLTASCPRGTIFSPPTGQFGEAERQGRDRSEEHTSELQSRGHLVCRLLLEKKKKRVCASAYSIVHEV